MFEVDSVQWEITDTFESVDTDTFEGVCEADVNGVTYWANCTIHKSRDMISGEILDVDVDTIERKGK